MADAARGVVMAHFRTAMLTVDDKDDSSPVTVADRECERALRALIARDHAAHGIVGEELGSERADAEWVWVIDPIDGTFVTGKPLFGTLIALLHRGRPVLGVIDHPALDVRYVGINGRPSTRNGKTIRARACPALKNAWLYATTPEMFRAGPEADGFNRLAKRIKHPVWGAECMAYGLLAEGFVDLVVEATMKPVDYLPLVAVVEGAGGVITDWRGRPLSLDSTGQVLAAGDPARHKDALALLNG
ncbi:MAG: histidinol phosphate phosphatase [Alphaproteobacteria bacterium]|nr:histidinol phosphate phosphatase [Alphaproteobacteria bacterium]